VLENRLMELVIALGAILLPVAAIAVIVLAVRRAAGRGAATTRLLNTLAVLSPVAFLLGVHFQSRLLAAVAGIMLGISAVAQIKRRGMRGNVLAWTGIALLTLLLGFFVASFILVAQLQGNIVGGHL
jgi:hypothetical protein